MSPRSKDPEGYGRKDSCKNRFTCHESHQKKIDHKTQAHTKNGSHEKRWDGLLEQAHRHGKKKIAAHGHQFSLCKIDDPARPVDQYKSATYQAVERSQDDRIHDDLHKENSSNR